MVPWNRGKEVLDATCLVSPNYLLSVTIEAVVANSMLGQMEEEGEVHFTSVAIYAYGAIGYEIM